VQKRSASLEKKGTPAGATEARAMTPQDVTDSFFILLYVTGAAYLARHLYVALKRKPPAR
jgi:hypothetical protein